MGRYSHSSFLVKFTLKGISNLTESPAYFQQVNGIYRKDGALALEKYADLAKQYKLMNLSCAGYEFIMVAAGFAEARVCLDPFGYDYDFAPGVLLVEEAGGFVATISGEEYDTDKKNFIAANSRFTYDVIINTLS